MIHAPGEDLAASSLMLELAVAHQDGYITSKAFWSSNDCVRSYRENLQDMQLRHALTGIVELLRALVESGKALEFHAHIALEMAHEKRRGEAVPDVMVSSAATQTDTALTTTSTSKSSQTDSTARIETISAATQTSWKGAAVQTRIVDTIPSASDATQADKVAATECKETVKPTCADDRPQVTGHYSWKSNPIDLDVRTAIRPKNPQIAVEQGFMSDSLTNRNPAETTADFFFHLPHITPWSGFRIAEKDVASIFNKTPSWQERCELFKEAGAIFDPLALEKELRDEAESQASYELVDAAQTLLKPEAGVIAPLLSAESSVLPAAGAPLRHESYKTALTSTAEAEEEAHDETLAIAPSSAVAAVACTLPFDTEFTEE